MTFQGFQQASLPYVPIAKCHHKNFQNNEILKILSSSLEYDLIYMVIQTYHKLIVQHIFNHFYWFLNFWILFLCEYQWLRVELVFYHATNNIGFKKIFMWNLPKYYIKNSISFLLSMHILLLLFYLSSFYFQEIRNGIFLFQSK